MYSSIDRNHLKLTASAWKATPICTREPYTTIYLPSLCLFILYEKQKYNSTLLIWW